MQLLPLARPFLIPAVVFCFLLAVFFDLAPRLSCPEEPWSLLPLPPFPSYLLHFIATIAVFTVLLALSNAPSAMLASLSFGLLPVTVDVAVVSPYELAAVATALMAVLLHLRRHLVTRVVCMVFYALAAAWSPSVWIVPILLISQDILYQKRPFRRWALWHLAMVATALAHLFAHAPMIKSVNGNPIRAMATHLVLSFDSLLVPWTTRLSDTMSLPFTIIVVLGAASACALAVVLAYRSPCEASRLMAWGSVWFIASVLSTAMLGSSRRAILFPLIGLAFVLAAAFFWLWTWTRQWLARGSYRAVFGVGIGALWLGLAALSARRAHEWSSDETALGLHCEAEMRFGYWEGAEEACNKALQRDENQVTTRYSLALSLRNLGRDKEAAWQVHQILEEHPDHSGARKLLATIKE